MSFWVGFDGIIAGTGSGSEPAEAIHAAWQRELRPTKAENLRPLALHDGIGKAVLGLICQKARQDSLPLTPSMHISLGEAVITPLLR